MSQLQKRTVVKTFTEHVMVKRCNAVLRLSKGDVKKLFWTEQKEEIPPDNDNFDFKTYLDYVYAYMNDCIQNGGELKREYFYGKGKTDGRIYVAFGKGLQSMQKKLRNYIAGDLYYDVDIVNCYPSLLLSLAEKHNLKPKLLREYVENREQILQQHNLKKLDFFNILFKDVHNIHSKKSDWYFKFTEEVSMLKQFLYDILEMEKIKTTNKLNPMSSRLAHYLGTMEHEIIMFAMNIMAPFAEVPMFDGFLVHRGITDNNEEAFDVLMQALNQQVWDKFGPYIQFSVKPTTNTVDLQELDWVPDEYPKVKERFEKEHFMTKKPFAYWKYGMNIGGTYTFDQIMKDDFKTACQEYQILHRLQNGRTNVVSIYDQWIQDVTKRQYEAVDFIPYNRINNVSAKIFNTFEGFAVNQEFENRRHEPRDTSNFFHMLNCLCDKKPDIYDYMVKYLAHLIQYPNYLTQKIIVIQSWTGTGKDSLFQTLSAIIGEEYCACTSQPEHIFGNFNVLCKNKLLLVLNEMRGLDGLRFEEPLKDFATSATVMINQKHMKAYRQTNSTRLFLMSNNDAPVNIQVSDRRYVIITAGFDLVVGRADNEKRQRNIEFWTKYHADLKDPHWRRSVYLALYNIDLSDFSPTKSPVTDAHQILREKNINPLFLFLQHLVEQEKAPDFLLERTIRGKPKHIVSQRVFYRQMVNFYEDKFEQECKMKDSACKKKLQQIANDAVQLNRRIKCKGEDGVDRVKEMTVFDLKKVKNFLDEYIFTTEDQDCLDIGSLTVSEVKRVTEVPKYGKKPSDIPGFDRL